MLLQGVRGAGRGSSSDMTFMNAQMNKSRVILYFLKRNVCVYVPGCDRGLGLGQPLGRAASAVYERQSGERKRGLLDHGEEGVAMEDRRTSWKRRKRVGHSPPSNVHFAGRNIATTWHPALEYRWVDADWNALQSG